MRNCSRIYDGAVGETYPFESCGLHFLRERMAPMVGFTSRIVGNGHAFMPSKEVVHPQSMRLSETLDPRLVGGGASQSEHRAG